MCVWVCVRERERERDGESVRAYVSMIWCLVVLENLGNIHD